MSTVVDAGQVEQVDMFIGGDEATGWGKRTAKERKADVDAAVAEIEGRQEDKPKPVSAPEPDPVPVVEDTTKTPIPGDETPAEDDAAEVPETEGEDEEAVPGKPVEQDWRDQETRDFASMMGLSDEDLADFGSREELDRALRIIDRKAFEAGKAAHTPAAEPEKPKVQQLEKPKEGPQATDDSLDDLSRFILKSTEHGGEFDPEAVKPLNAFIEATANTIRQLRSELGAFRQGHQRQAAAEIRQRAVNALHSLGNADLFGKPGEKPTKEQSANVERALDAHFVHARGLLAQGRQVAPTPAFLKAAVNLEFGDQLLKQQKQQQIEKLKKQSARRTGGTAGKRLPSPPPDNETSQEASRRIAADPEILAAWRKATQE